MNQRLLALYGLKWNPFSPELPTEAIFVPPKLENFCWRIEHAQIREGGFAMIHGDPGTGKSIALRRNEKILTRDLTRGTEKLLSPEDWPHCSGPAWKPDGEVIAFAARWEAGNGVFTVAAKGGKPVKVYDRQGACEPHWSPDGARLAYETETHICTINPDGTKNRVITPFGGVQRYARYSPDGKFLVFCQGASEQGPWELYVIPSAGGTPRKLTESGSDMYPDWR